MPKPPAFRPINQMNADQLIVRPEAAEERRRSEEVAQAQATLDCLSTIQSDENSLFGLMLQAAIQHNGALSYDEIRELEESAKQVNDRRQKKKWDEVASALADIGITETGKGQRHMVWAAKKFGVDLVPVTEVAELPRLEAVKE